MNLESCKKSAALEAIKHVKDHMLVGLGTGSTVYYFIEALIKKVQAGLKIHVVSSSEKSTELALKGGLHFANIQAIDHIDLTVDGADAIDAQKRMIKGGGGALLREKILAAASKHVVIIVDETKVVKDFSHQKLPVEILPFGVMATLAHIHRAGFQGSVRKLPTSTPFVTDNGNFIFDIMYTEKAHGPEKDNTLLKQIPGVVETGLFFNLAHNVYIGHQDGHVTLR